MNKEVFLVNSTTVYLNDAFRMAYCMSVFGNIESANVFINGIKDEINKGNTTVIAPDVLIESVSDETHDTPQGFTRRKVVYRWTNPVTSNRMRTTFEIEQRQVF